jgi:hypothetical protein
MRRLAPPLARQFRESDPEMAPFSQSKKHSLASSPSHRRRFGAGGNTDLRKILFWRSGSP